MSKYTTELRFILETLAGKTESEGYDSVEDIIETARPLLFNFDYPIFDEEYRPVLETKILRHYYTREICAETVGRWKLFLQAELNEIMPYYNQLYHSAQLQYNPLVDADYIREGQKHGQKSEVGSRSNTGTVGDAGTTQNTQTSDVATANTRESSESGTDNRTTNNTESTSDVRTDALTETTSGTRTDDLTQVSNAMRTDNLHESSDSTRTDNLTEETDTTRTDNLNRLSTDGGTESTETERADKNDKWDLYSDTPQGGIAGLEGTTDSSSLGENAYLTNARHITDDSTGSNSTAETTFGKTVNVADTGTQRSVGEKTNTGTQRVQGQTDNTGTQQTDGLIKNTGTQQNAGTRSNTGTQEHDSNTTGTGTDNLQTSRTGTVQDNGSQTGRVVDNGSSSNTRTYNLQDSSNGTATDTGTYLEHVFGKMPGASYPKLILDYRETLINIDMLIIKALSDLFMRIW